MNPRQGDPVPDHRKQIASLPIAVLLLGPDGRIVQANPAAEQFLGQSSRRLMGKVLLDQVGIDDERLVARIRDPEAPVSAREIDVAIFGQPTRRIDLTSSPVVDEAGWQVITLVDSAPTEAMGDTVTPRENAVLRAPEILAHEIKNPLAGIRGAAQLLGRKVDGHDRSLTRLIADEVDRIAKLIDQMQTLSRQTSEPVTPCNLHEVIRHAGALMVAANPEQVLEEEFDPSLPDVLGSPSSLVQVLINLLANARDAAVGPRRPRIVLRTRYASGLQLQSSRRGDPLPLPIELRVSDNGPGIDPALRDLIFEPFVTTKKTGQGLGLALVRKLVGEMNGRITHERDEAGGWTHFRIHLAEAPSATTRRRRSGETARAAPQSAQGLSA